MSSEASFRPNTTVRIYRDDEDNPKTNDFGDVVANSTEPFANSIPIVLTHKSVRQFRPDENRATTVNYVTARIRSTAGVEPGDRIEDERNGQIYFVEEVVAPFSSTGAVLQRLSLVRVGRHNTYP